MNGSERFTACAQRVVDHLNAHTELGDWSVSRMTQGEQVLVHVHRENIVEVGMRVDLEETFCDRMVHGAARFVPDALEHPDYRDLPGAQQVRSYAGVPIPDGDGGLFGVLCGFGAEPKPGLRGVDPDLLELLAALLSEQLASSRELDRDRRQLEMAEALTHRDDLTGLLNRRGWDAVVADAQERIDAFGDLVGVVVLDLDGLKAVNDREGHQAGDALIRTVGAVLRDNVRADDRAARYGGDEFAVLVENIPASALERYCDRLDRAFERAGVSVSVGFVSVGPSVGLVNGFAAADREMYAVKRRKRLQLT